MKHSEYAPPKFWRFLLTGFLSSYSENCLTEDLEEEFHLIRKESGVRRARYWYSWQVIKSLPFMVNTHIYWSRDMLSNYLKIAVRNLQKHRLYSFLNIAGLAVGIACCLLITLWIFDELSFDRFHEHADRLYRVEFDQDYSGQLYHVNVSPHPMGPALKIEIPEVEDAARINPIGEILVRYGEKTFLEDSAAAVDPSFLKIFSFPLLHGDVRTALDNPHSIIITEEKALKYFGRVDVIGKTLTLNNQLDLTVTGVMRNIPRTSYLQFDLVVPYEILGVMGWNLEKWTDNQTLTFVLLSETSQPEPVAQKILALVTKHDSGEGQEYSLRPLTQIHLFSHFGFGDKRGNAQYIAIFSAIAVFVLLIACINFMNLSTARAAKRAREVGMRKVVGAVKRQIVQQFYSESCVFVVLSLLLAIFLVWLVLPVFNTLSGKDLSLYALSRGLAPLALSGILFMTGIIAGSYPALYLSSFHPVKVLKATIGSGRSSSIFRKVLVVVQFSLSIALIIGTGIVYSQLGFIKEKSLGFDKDHLITIPIRGRGVQDSYGALKKELLKQTGVVAVSAAEFKPSGIHSNSDGADWEGKDPEKEVSVYFTSVNYDYFETADMGMMEGRSYSLDFPSDVESAYVVNEELRKLMGAKSAIGKRFTFGDKTCTIIGVVKDFHFLSLKKKIEPLVLLLNPGNMNYILARIRPENIASTLSGIEKTWNKVIPGFPFDYSFINEDFDILYKAENRMGVLLKYFSFLAVFIACLGLFGLISFAAEQRTREIGIRKVLGASITKITLMLCKEFTLLVLLANIIAWPVAFLAMQNWLLNFAYRTTMSWGTFLSAGVLALLIALLTVSFQAVKAALINPARALKYE